MTALQPNSTVRTTCSYCGVGCQMNLQIKGEQIYCVEAPFDGAELRQSLRQRALRSRLRHSSAPLEETVHPR
ncbi:MAG: hypothetical protein OXI30_16720 [Chloroflexota bacterium]|nr:hypothetical protein [Chloroflexota bacterium]